LKFGSFIVLGGLFLLGNFAHVELAVVRIFLRQEIAYLLVLFGLFFADFLDQGLFSRGHRLLDDTNFATVSDNALFAGGAGHGADLLKLVEDFEGCWSHLTEDTVLSVQMRSGLEAHEELRAVRVGTRVSH